MYGKLPNQLVLISFILFNVLKVFSGVNISKLFISYFWALTLKFFSITHNSAINVFVTNIFNIYISFYGIECQGWNYWVKDCMCF